MSRHLLPNRRRDLTGRVPVGVFVPVTTMIRMALGLVVTAILVIALTNPSGARTSGTPLNVMALPASQQQDHFAQCLRDWDAATHMTKREWRDTCRRLLLPRRDHPSNPDQSRVGTR